MHSHHDASEIINKSLVQGSEQDIFHLQCGQSISFEPTCGSEFQQSITNSQGIKLRLSEHLEESEESNQNLPRVRETESYLESMLKTDVDAWLQSQDKKMQISSAGNDRYKSEEESGQKRILDRENPFLESPRCIAGFFC